MTFFDIFRNPKPYSSGHRLVHFPKEPSLSPAVLDMPAYDAPDHLRLPERLILRLRIDRVPYEGSALCEVIKDGHSLGQTPLYHRGPIQEGETRLLKRYGRNRSVRLQYTGRGFYPDVHERWIPFYPDSKMSRLLGMDIDTSLFEKTFDVAHHSFTQHLRRGEINDLIYYPYGGVVAEEGPIDRIEPVLCRGVSSRSEDREIAALLVERASILRERGIEPGVVASLHDARYRIQGWDEGLITTSLGDDVRQGALRFTIQTTYETRTFVSEGYEERRGRDTTILVECVSR